MSIRYFLNRCGVARIALALTGALIMTPSLAATPIKTGGTGSAIRVVVALGTVFKQTYPDAEVVVLQGLGSGGAIKALNAQAIELALSARPLKPAEQGQALQASEVARTPLVFAGVKPYPGLSRAKVADILLGKQQVWPDGSPLRPVLRPKDDSEAMLLRASSPAMDQALGIALARPGMHVALTDSEALEALQSVPGAFGFTTLAMLKEAPSVRPFALDQVTPSLGTLSSGRYRLSKPLYLVIRENAPESVRAFVAFIQSAQGAKILADHGYLALAAAKRN